MKATVSEECTIESNGITIAYDTIGNSDETPMLLIHGLGAQLIAWDLDFCRRLASRGYFVIRFDNRDVGHSTRLTDYGIPDLTEFMGALVGTPTPAPPYTLKDMAGDAVAVLDALDIDSAHVLGVSAGGMIAQTVAIHHPQRVRTLISIMSSTGRPHISLPEPQAMELLTKPPATSLEQHVEMEYHAARLLHGPRYSVNEGRVRQRASDNWQRGLSPDGTARQLAAVMGSGSRHEALQEVTAPTLVIHGDADPLVKLEAGKDTANVIPEAKLHIMKGVGHVLPEEIWEEILDLIAAHAK